MFRLVLLLCLTVPTPSLWASKPIEHRVEKYAVYKAHTILPETLRFLVRKNGKSLFLGMEAGLRVDPKRINERVILGETRRISELVEARAPFPKVVRQMGFVSGLVAVYTDPTRNASAVVRQGFPYYTNAKLNRFHFVFDGYQSLDTTYSWLRNELPRTPERRADHLKLLEKRYTSTGNNPRKMFDERDAVFGVSSLYFSNLARYSAHLWYYAWGSAQGDLTRMPFKRDSGVDN